MTSCVRILSTSTIDSSPSILIISNGNNNNNNSATPDKKRNMNSKILINCGEGCQRTFVEYSQRLSTITTVCVCSLNNSHNDNVNIDMIGGLPGAILTISDTTASTQQLPIATTVMKHKTKNISSEESLKQQSQSSLSTATASNPPFHIIGPMGIKDYISSLRHFMRRDTFQYTIDEVMIENSNENILNVSSTTSSAASEIEYHQNAKSKKQNTTGRNTRKKETTTNNDDENQPTFGFTIQSIAFSDQDLMSSPSIMPLHPVTRKRSLDDALMEHTDEPHKNTAATACIQSASEAAIASTATSTSLLDHGSDKRNGIPQQVPSKPEPNSVGGYVSFILRTPPIPGKFLIEKAIALGIPKGPLYKQLKMGQNVSFPDATTNEMKHVNSSEVVEPSTPPIVVMILYYPTNNVAKQLFSYIKSCSEDGNDETGTPELVIHLTSSCLFHQYGISHWNQSHNVASDNGYSKKVDHILLPVNDLKSLDGIDVDSNVSPFRSAMLGAYARSLIHPDIYVCPHNQVQLTTTGDSTNLEPASTNADEYHIGRPTMEYTILPRSKRGVVPVVCANNSDNQATIPINTDEEAMEQLVERTGASILAQEIINEHTSNDKSMVAGDSHGIEGDGELIFTGTASALPCKHRNVTGMLLKQSDQRSIILDIGEGTMGQLLRMRSSSDDTQQRRRHIYNEIKAVWISHPHADHHLGLIRLLKDRRQFETEKLLIIGPTPIFRFLDEVSAIDHEILGTYISIDCKDLVGESPEFLPHQQTVQDILGITRCRAVPVAHCAHAYAVILDGTSFGRVVYSGDCRPSTQLAMIAKGADILIHESTFESDMQADAVLKKHSTIDEALNVGRQMECKCIILTHFSQRYSKVPPLPSKSDDSYPFPIIYAYDFMRLKPHTLFLASKLTPALRLLFADDIPENSDIEANGLDPIESFNRADVLSIPGAFANASLL